jgi:hypothetical protein
MQIGIVFSQEEIVEMLTTSIAKSLDRAQEDLFVTLRKDIHGKIEATVMHKDGRTHLTVADLEPPSPSTD